MATRVDSTIDNVCDSLADASDDDSALASLSEEQVERLTKILDDYLCKLESGDRVNVCDVIAANEDIADVLQCYFDKLSDLHGIAAGFQGDLVEADSPIDMQLGDYTIVREIGRGGMGIVFEATQKPLDRRVALKLLPMASLLDSRQVARFKNESHAAGQLQHPNIVPVHSVGVERGIHYYAMQLIEGTSIESVIARQRKGELPKPKWRDVLAAIIEVADALDYAHGCGIIHRDIKPANLIVDESSRTENRDNTETPRIWITDFGLARCQNNLSLTRSGDLVGTMRYMSPEQARGVAELVDQRTDIYSLAVTLYEMLTLQRAVPGEDGPGVLRSLDVHTPPRVKKVLGDVPTDLDVVLSKAMAKIRDDRYSTAKEFADDLRCVLSGEATKAKPLSLMTRASRAALRHRRWVTAASIVMVVATTWLVISTWIIRQKSASIAEHAERTDNIVRSAHEMVNQLGGDVAQQLALMPGAEQLRRDVLQETLSYHTQFVEQAGDDPLLQPDLAITHTRIGNLVNQLETPEQAVPHFRKAEQLYQRLVTVEPRLRAERAENLNQLGLALGECRKLEEADRVFRQSIAIHKQLAVGDADARDVVAYALTVNNQGLLFRQLGQHEQALACWNLAHDQLTPIVAQNPSQAAQRGLAAVCLNLSSLETQRDPAQARALLNQALDLQLASAKVLPNPLAASVEIATTYNNLGSAEINDRDFTAARASFGQAIGLQRKLVASAPRIASHRRELAVSLNNLSKALHLSQELQQAQQAVAEAIELQKACLERRPDDAAIQSQYGAMNANAGVVFLSAGDHRRAAEYFGVAIKSQQNAVAMAATTAEANQYVRLQLDHLQRFLRLQVLRGQWDGALQTSQLLQQAAGDDPNHLMQVAEIIAESFGSGPDDRRAQSASLVAATLGSARDAGHTLDKTILTRPPFRSFADSKTLLRVVNQ